MTQNGGSNPLWRRDGRELFYRRGIGTAGGTAAATLLAVDITLGAIPRWNPERITPINGFVVTGTREYDITPDGERFIMVFPPAEAAGPPPRPRINVVQDWFQELRDRVPVN